MIEKYETLALEITNAIHKWENRLQLLNEEQITIPRNSQHRNIRQILGHMVDSASNNTHRAVHLQYRENPVEFPNYATNGNNDRWIAIQNYEQEDWQHLIQLWKYSNLHYAHVVRQIRAEFLQQKWIAAPNVLVSLDEMVTDYPLHLYLHLNEIEELIKESAS